MVTSLVVVPVRGDGPQYVAVKANESEGGGVALADVVDNVDVEATIRGCLINLAGLQAQVVPACWHAECLDLDHPVVALDVSRCMPFTPVRGLPSVSHSYARTKVIAAFSAGVRRQRFGRFVAHVLTTAEVRKWATFATQAMGA
jgi:hypothetical protein